MYTRDSVAVNPEISGDTSDKSLELSTELNKRSHTQEEITQLKIFAQVDGSDESTVKATASGLRRQREALKRFRHVKNSYKGLYSL